MPTVRVEVHERSRQRKHAHPQFPKRPTLRRRLCQGLKEASISLGMIRLQFHVGLLKDAEVNLGKIHEEIQLLRLQLEGKKKKALPSHSASKAISERTASQPRDKTLLAECLG